MENKRVRYHDIRAAAMRWSRQWFGTWAEKGMAYLFLFPDLIHLMIKLLGDHRVVIIDKIFVAGVLIYVISPIDFFPEILTGPFGLIEDFFLTLVVLYRLLSNPYNSEAIEAHWQGDRRMLAKIRRGCQYVKVLMMKRHQR